MRKLVIILVAVALLCSLFPSLSSAGPWTLNRNKLWMEVFTRYFASKMYWDSEYTRHEWQNNGRSAIWDLDIKFEYGLTDDLNILVGLPYAWSRWRNDWDEATPGDNPKHEGFKSCSVGLKYKFMSKPAVAAGQIKFYLQPQHTDRTLAPDLSEYGDAIELRGLLGNSWKVLGGRQFYMSAESGYGFRTDWVNKSEYANWIPVFFEAGLAPVDRMMWKAEIDCYISDPATGIIKDTYTWRTGPIFIITGKGFNSIEKGEDAPDEGININLELQYGRTFLGRGDPENREEIAPEPGGGSDKVSAAQEFIFKVQVLF